MGPVRGFEGELPLHQEVEDEAAEESRGAGNPDIPVEDLAQENEEEKSTANESPPTIR